MSTLNVNTITPNSGTTVTIGGSGDTITVPSGATLSGAGAITVPSGGSLTINSGATITNNGTNGGGFGKVLQVVQGTYATQTSTTGTTPVTSNLSASITPSSTSNKVLLLATVNSCYTTGSPAGGYLWIYRDGSDLLGDQAAFYYNGNGSIIGTISLNYLDSPSSTSSLTYEIYFSKQTGTNTVVHDSGNPSFIVLMEIAG